MHKEEAELVRIETLLNRAHVEDEIIKLKSLVMIIKQRILLQKHAIAEEQLQDLQVFKTHKLKSIYQFNLYLLYVLEK